MKVYALERHYDYEGSILLSIHATRESAERKGQEDARSIGQDDVEFIEQTAGFWKTWNSPEFHITEHDVEP